MLIDWQDQLHFERTASPTISRSDLASTTALPADDLCVRAARALQAATGCTQGAHIGLEKSIPAQAGMGGGSSNAATTLLALNRLWQLHLPRADLERIGLTLGADVPFFLRGRNAWVEGVGEQITPLSGAATLPPARFIVLKPQAGLDTGKIFSSPSLQRATKLATIAGFAADHYGFGHNDLQPVASSLCPEIQSAIAFLGQQGFAAKMTGSGSAVFAKIEQTTCIASTAWQSKVCENLQKHPLLEWAQD